MYSPLCLTQVSEMFKNLCFIVLLVAFAALPGWDCMHGAKATLLKTELNFVCSNIAGVTEQS